jgi:glucokinase
VFNVEQRLHSLTGMKAKAGNDANVAALGEMWQGGGKGYQNIVMVTLGTGVGGGVIVGGKILAGINGAAGELGHMPMFDDDPEPCGCGKRGCLEQYTSANGIVRITKRYFAAHPKSKSTLNEMEKYTSKEIFDEAKKGDEVALKMVDQVGNLLGKALATTACVVNPEAFVIGGGMSKAGPILIEAIRKEFKRYAFHASRETEFKLAELGNNAGIYGGVRMVLE